MYDFHLYFELFIRTRFNLKYLFLLFPVLAEDAIKAALADYKTKQVKPMEWNERNYNYNKIKILFSLR